MPANLSTTNQRATRPALIRMFSAGICILIIASTNVAAVVSEALGENSQVILDWGEKTNEKVLTTSLTAHGLIPEAAAMKSKPAPSINLADSHNQPVHNPSEHDWPCWLPEGCGDLYLPANPDLPAQLSSDAPNLLVTSMSAPAAQNDSDDTWQQRYEVYQQIITEASEPLVELGVTQAPTSEGRLALHILHGREDVQNNADYIQAVGQEFPAIPPILVGAAIAEQASDVERLFGTDTLEKAALALPGLENMSVGIAQLRPEEALSLGLGRADLFDPQTAVEGMYTKISMANLRIDVLEDSHAPLSPTERYMVLSLAQNSTGKVDEYFAASGDWTIILTQGNNTRVMRYFLVHLDWLLDNGWELPPNIDLDYWHKIVFSAPGSPSEGE